MFRIGDFARFTRVSVKMLRHYDEIGLLEPARVDPATGYRYYAANQVPRLNRIIALKDLGFSLEQIAGLLSEDLSLDQVRGMLKLRRAEIEGHLQQERARLAQVEAQLAHLESQAQLPAFDVVLRAVPPQLVASIRQVLAEDEEAAPLFDEVEAFAARHQARAPLSPLALYYNSELDEDRQDIEVAVPLLAQPTAAGRIAVRELPALPAAACVVYEGSYERGADALQALLVWTEANDYRAAGPMREVYLRFNADHAHELGLPQAFLAGPGGQLVTELQLPVERRGS